LILVLDISNPVVPVLCDEFVSPVARIIEQKGISVKKIHISDLIQIKHKVTGIIICGTALADSWYKDKRIEPLVSRYNVPILGICAGMQMLLSESGGVVIQSLEIGMIPVTLSCDGKEDILTKGKDEFSGYALHQYATTIPETWTVLAHSKNTAQIVRYSDKFWYGVLFHPEVRNEWIIERFVDITIK